MFYYSVSFEISRCAGLLYHTIKSMSWVILFTRTQIGTFSEFSRNFDFLRFLWQERLLSQVRSPPSWTTHEQGLLKNYSLKNFFKKGKNLQFESFRAPPYQWAGIHCLSRVEISSWCENHIYSHKSTGENLLISLHSYTMCPIHFTGIYLDSRKIFWGRISARMDSWILCLCPSPLTSAVKSLVATWAVTCQAGFIREWEVFFSALGGELQW